MKSLLVSTTLTFAWQPARRAHSTIRVETRLVVATRLRLPPYQVILPNLMSEFDAAHTSVSENYGEDRGYYGSRQPCYTSHPSNGNANGFTQWRWRANVTSLLQNGHGRFLIRSELELDIAVDTLRGKSLRDGRCNLFIRYHWEESNFFTLSDQGNKRLAM